MTLNDMKVFSAYVVNISEIIYDTSTETEIANKKSQSFQVIRLSMTLAIFQGH